MTVWLVSILSWFVWFTLASFPTSLEEKNQQNNIYPESATEADEEIDL